MNALLSITEEGATSSATLAERLTGLADTAAKISHGDRRRLRGLAAALRGEGAAGEWTGVDLYRMFDVDAIAAEKAALADVPARLHWLELLRNLLILAPVGWTWFGVSAAANAYQQTLTADPNLGPQPFLLLWQRGFYGRLPWLPFSRMAFIDTALVIIVVALTLLLHFRVDQAEVAREAAVRRARRDFDDLLADAALLLSGQESGRPGRFLDEFAHLGERLLGELATERERLDRMAEQRERQLNELTAFAAGLIAGSNQLLEVAQRFAGTYAELSQAMRMLSGNVAAMAAGQDEALENGRRLGGLLERWVIEAQHLVGSLHDALEGIGAASRVLQQGGGVLTGALDRVATQLPEAVRSIEGVAQGARTMLEAAGSFASSSGSLTQAVDKLGGAVGTGAAAQQQLVAAEDAVSDRLGELLTAQMTLAATMRDTLNAVAMLRDPFVSGVGALSEVAQSLQAGQAGYIAGLHSTTDAQQTFLDRLTRNQAARDRTDAELVATQQQFLTGLAGERQAQTELAQAVAQATLAVAGTMEAVHDESTTLNGLAMSLDDLARSFPRFVQEFQSALNDVLTTQAATSEQLATTGMAAQTSVQTVVAFTDGWQQAVSGLVTQCQELTGVLRELQYVAGQARPSNAAGDASTGATRTAVG